MRTKADKCLCIIDMQPAFRAAEDKQLITSVKRLINEFKRKQLPIIVVEFAPKECGTTLLDVYNPLKGYPNHTIITKYEDDGSVPIIVALTKLKVASDNFTLCGVNRSYCVKSTQLGLEKYNKQVEIVEEACGDTF